MTELKNIRAQRSSKVLLIGDSCIDEYKIGSVDRLSPEAPVPIIKILETTRVPGMAANVNLNFLNLGIVPEFVSNTTEIIKTRYIDKRSGQHLIRVDTDPEIDQWRGQTVLSLDSYDAIVISDYNKGFLSYENIQHLIRGANCPVFIDTKKSDLSKFTAEWVFVKINETEYKNRSSTPQNLIVTLGEKGAMLKQGSTEMTYGTDQVEVMDVCGCGDTFLASLVSRYLITNNIEDAILFANIAAGITVQHRGNYAPTMEDILNA